VTLRGIGETVGDKTSADPLNRVVQGPADGNGVPVAVVRLETNWSTPGDPRATDPTDRARTKDNDLWQAMDAACRELAVAIANGGPIQYLSRPNDTANAHWQDAPPSRPLGQDTLSSTHHEAGTLWMGTQAQQSVTDHLGRIWELQNLFAVGPALLPTIGSPNPMLSGVALARRTADKLLPPTVLPAPETNFRRLFDGNTRTFHRWRTVGPGGFALLDGELVAQPRGDHSLFFYAAESFSNFVLRLQFRLPGPVDAFGKAIGNSGVFVRFRYPHSRWDDVNGQVPAAAGNPAWVAAVTGFEVQIDEQGKDNFYKKHRTGAIYDVPAGDTVNGQVEPTEQSYATFGVLQAQHWYEYEIEVKNDTFVVRIRDAESATPGTFQKVSSFTKPAGKYIGRGVPASADARSGYIGIQAHTEAVRFRDVRIRTL
jgi:hypothetical protein